MTTNPFNYDLIRYLRRGEAMGYLRRSWGLHCAISTLVKLAGIGGGPRLIKAEWWPYYCREDLDAWALSKLRQLKEDGRHG